MRVLFESDAGKCTACSACVIACMDQNDIDIEARQKPFRRIVSHETEDGELSACSMSCMHCKDAPCIAACPAGCLTKDGSTGLTLLDNTGCIGCQSCYSACPFGAPTFFGGKMIKCDGCAVRVREGFVPACVRACPTGALILRRADGNG